MHWVITVLLLPRVLFCPHICVAEKGCERAAGAEHSLCEPDCGQCASDDTSPACPEHAPCHEDDGCPSGCLCQTLIEPQKTWAPDEQYNVLRLVLHDDSRTALLSAHGCELRLTDFKGTLLSGMAIRIAIASLLV